MNAQHFSEIYRTLLITKKLKERDVAKAMNTLVVNLQRYEKFGVPAKRKNEVMTVFRELLFA